MKAGDRFGPQGLFTVLQRDRQTIPEEARRGH